MSFEPFNSVGGYTVGIPPVPVITEDGIGTFTGLQLSGIVNLGSVANVRIFGGQDGYVLQTNGSGQLTWTAQGGGNGGVPGGSNTEVQFNNNGIFGGNAGFTYNSTTGQLNITGNVVANNFVGNVSVATFANTAGRANTANTANTVINNAQPNITSVGTLTNLNVSGNIVASNIVANQNFSALNATITDSANLNGVVTVGVTGNLVSLGNVDFYQVPNISFGSISNLHIAGGIPGYFLRTDGAGNLSWAPGGGGGNGSPGGNSTTVQFNDNGVFGGSANFTYNKFNYTLGIDNIHSINESIDHNLTVNALANVNNLYVNGNANIYGNLDGTQSPNVTLGPVANIHITGGSNGQVLTTDGYGNLSWSTGGTGNGVPGGANTQVQFNNNGVFGASSSFTFDSTSGLLTTPAIKATTTANFQGATNVNLGSIANLHISGGTNGYVLQTDGAGVLSWTAQTGGGGNGTPGGANTQVQFNSDGTFGGNTTFTFNNTTGVMQVPYITSNFTGNGANLTNLNGANITGTVANAAYATNAGSAIVATLAGGVTNSNQPNITSVGTLTSVTVAGNAVLGNIANVKITGGSANYYLQTDGTGNLSWVPGGGGGGNPGGSNTQIQFNNNGAFAGSPYLTYNNTSHTLQVAGDFVSNSISIGSGVYNFSRTSVYFATSVTTAETLLMVFPTANTAGLDFTIISTDPTAGNRQICKLEAVYYANTVHYNEYNTIQVNGPVGDFAITYDAGDIINPPRASLYVFPTTSNMTTYKIQVTAYAE